MPRLSSKRKSRSPCKHGRKKSARKGCKAKPGPKRRRRSRKSYGFADEAVEALL